MSEEAAQLLTEYRWPGNVRELENFVQSMVVIRESETLQVADLPHYMAQSRVCIDQRGGSLNEIMEEMEKELLRTALQEKKSVAAVAGYYKVDRTTIFRKLKRYGLIQ